jgi:small conductance mechanosensitive channel
VVLDYVMGFLILIEGPYFKGDWIKVNGATAIEGTVEEIGLRRTLLRDGFGSVHAVSNGLIRLSTNVTRVYSVATVEVPILRGADMATAIEVATRVTRELRAEPEWAERIPEDMTTDLWVTALSGIYLLYLTY